MAEKKSSCHVSLAQYAHVALILVILSPRFASSSDQDPLQDICVADVASALHPNGLLCKPLVLVEPEDFVFRGLRVPTANLTSTPTGMSRTLASVHEFPALNTLGISLLRADFAPGGVNPPHLHPRASEIALVAKGTFYAGFITTDGQLYARTLEPGDVMVFPRALVHFQIHLGKEDNGVLYGSLNSQNPGTVVLPPTLFGSNIPDEILLKSFHITPDQLLYLRSKFQTPKPPQ